MAKRQLTEAARAAKLIRAHLKKNGIKASVSSFNFSMGNSVDIRVIDLTSAARKAVEEYCGQYQYGHFDGMTDCYHYSNKNADIPQSKFVTVTCEYSDTLKQQAWEWLCSRLGGMENAPASHTDAGNYMNENACQYGDVLLQRVLNGQSDFGFWTSRKPHIRSN